MSVSSVKNLNGGVFSAVQDAELTEVVQTNSGNWQDITAYQNASAGYLTAHQDISNLMPKSDSANFYPMEGNPSGFLITHQAISADEWNSNYETVTTNSGVWGGSALPVSAGQGVKINLIDNTLVFSNDETVLWSGSRTSAVQTSESMKNFDKCQVYIAHGTYGPPQVYTLDFADMSTTGYFAITRPRGASNLNVAYIRLTADNTHLAAVNAKCLAFGSWTTTATGVTATTGESEDLNSIIKVIGINRVAGGN
jgi:hypothetical protein